MDSWPLFTAYIHMYAYIHMVDRMPDALLLHRIFYINFRCITQITAVACIAIENGMLAQNTLPTMETQRFKCNARYIGISLSQHIRCPICIVYLVNHQQLRILVESEIFTMEWQIQRQNRHACCLKNSRFSPSVTSISPSTNNPLKHFAFRNHTVIEHRQSKLVPR